MRRAMKVAIPAESHAGEKRVAIVPESVKRLAAKKISLAIESGAGARSNYGDDEYRGLGATVEASAGALLADADVVIRLRVPTIDEISALKEGTALVAPIYPLVRLDLVRALAERKVTTISVDSIPRTTVAQMMDVRARRRPAPATTPSSPPRRASRASSRCSSPPRARSRRRRCSS